MQLFSAEKPVQTDPAEFLLERQARYVRGSSDRYVWVVDSGNRKVAFVGLEVLQ